MKGNAIKSLGIICMIAFCAVAGTLLGYKLYQDHQATKDVDKFLKQVKMVAQVDYGSVSKDLLNGDITIKDINIMPYMPTAEPLHLNQIVYQINKDGDDITLLSVRVRGVKIPITLPNNHPRAAELADFLAKMELEALDCDIHFVMRYKPIERDLLVKVTQDAKGLFSFGVAAMIGNFNPFAKDPKAAQNAQIKHLRVQYIDHSFAKKFMVMMQKEFKVPKAVAMAKLEQEVAQELAKEKDPLKRQLIVQAVKFIKAPKNFVVDAKPSPPVTVLELMMLPPSKMVERLNVKVGANV